jgi:hypothetical protein
LDSSSFIFHQANMVQDPVPISMLLSDKVVDMKGHVESYVPLWITKQVGNMYCKKTSARDFSEGTVAFCRKFYPSFAAKVAKITDSDAYHRLCKIVPTIPLDRLGSLLPFYDFKSLEIEIKNADGSFQVPPKDCLLYAFALTQPNPPYTGAEYKILQLMLQALPEVSAVQLLDVCGIPRHGRVMDFGNMTSEHHRLLQLCLRLDCHITMDPKGADSAGVNSNVEAEIIFQEVLELSTAQGKDMQTLFSGPEFDRHLQEFADSLDKDLCGQENAGELIRQVVKQTVEETFNADVTKLIRSEISSRLVARDSELQQAHESLRKAKAALANTLSSNKAQFTKIQALEDSQEKQQQKIRNLSQEAKNLQSALGKQKTRARTAGHDWQEIREQIVEMRRSKRQAQQKYHELQQEHARVAQELDKSEQARRQLQAEA